MSDEDIFYTICSVTLFFAAISSGFIQRRYAREVAEIDKTIAGLNRQLDSLESQRRKLREDHQEKLREIELRSRGKEV